MNVLHLGNAVFLCLVVASPGAFAAAEACGTSAKSSDKSYLVRETTYLRSNPSPSSSKLVNEKGSKSLGEKVYMSIDSSSKVQEECTRADWSRVAITVPEWLSTQVGWVPSKVLRKAAVDANGIREFVEDDFLFDNSTRKYKKVIIAGANKVHRENARCRTIDPRSAYLSDMGTTADPIFFVTCGEGAGLFNAFFSASEVKRGVVLGEKKHVSQPDAIAKCENYATSKSTHPSTVSFRRLLGLQLTEHPSGRTRVSTTFTAKNSFNLELKFKIDCLLDSSGFFEANIAEVR